MKGIDREYALANPVARERLPAYLFHGSSGEDQVLGGIERDGLCPSRITGAKGWTMSDPAGVYVDANPEVAYTWGGRWPVVLVVKSKDLSPKCRIYYDWNMPLAKSTTDLRDSGQAYVITACGCLSPVYALVLERIQGKFEIVILPLAQARRKEEIGLVDRWQLRRFMKTL